MFSFAAVTVGPVHVFNLIRRVGGALILLLVALFLSSPVRAACPDFLDHDLRKLHSSQTVNLCELHAGGPMLIVNTASHCGYTPQFKGLEALYQEYRERGLQVVGFSSDDFRQEANSEEEAASICYVNFGVTFPMIAPTHVKGDKANPVFRELARQSKAPGWNFNKYLVAADGEVVQRFGSNTRPDSDSLRSAIEAELPLPAGAAGQ